MQENKLRERKRIFDMLIEMGQGVYIQKFVLSNTKDNFKKIIVVKDNNSLISAIESDRDT